MATITEKTNLTELLKEGTHFRTLARRRTIGAETLHKMWCPAMRALALQKKIYEEKIFEGWAGSAVREVAGGRYLVATRGKNTRAYPVLRYYRLANGRVTNEVDSLGFLFDQPNQSGCIPPEGANILGKMYPVFEDGENRAITGNQMTRATPVGKKGVVMLHTMNQVCDLKMVRGGYFQRFTPAANFMMSVQRAAITLRRLGAGDPKSTEQGTQALAAELLRQMPQLAAIAADQLDRVATASEYSLQSMAETFSRALPLLRLEKVEVRVVHDRIGGPDPRTWILSIHSHSKDASEDENQKSFSDAWNLLIS